MTKWMKTGFISKPLGILRALPFCLIFFHFRTSFLGLGESINLHVLYGIERVTANENTLMKKLLTTLLSDYNAGEKTLLLARRK